MSPVWLSADRPVGIIGIFFAVFLSRKSKAGAERRKILFMEDFMSRIDTV